VRHEPGFAPFAIVAGFSALVGCSRRETPQPPLPVAAADGATGGAASVSPLHACEAYVRSFCAKEMRCDGDSEAAKACAAHMSLCPEYYFAPDSTRTTATLEECARAFDDLSCEDFLAGVRPPCVTPGLRGPGERCVAPSQCASLDCEGFGPDKCGVCTNPAQPKTLRLPRGAACGLPNAPADRCEGKLDCVLASPDARAGTCLPLPVSGAPCVRVLGAREARCAPYPVYCRFGDAGVGSGTCARAGVPGDPCGARAGASAPPCDGALGICATFPDGRGACVAYAKLGARCGAPFEACAPDAYCKPTVPGRPGGVCTELPGPGAACGASAADAGLPFLGCASGNCAPSPDGGKSVCFGPADRGRGEACAPPLTNCNPLLTCDNGVCVALDPAKCSRRGAAADAGPGR
jgi:hypothetical protein